MEKNVKWKKLREYIQDLLMSGAYNLETIIGKTKSKLFYRVDRGKRLEEVKFKPASPAHADEKTITGGACINPTQRITKTTFKPSVKKATEQKVKPFKKSFDMYTVSTKQYLTTNKKIINSKKF
ncbi:hypothetical protein H5410_043419 [Solanum commersonii]|uniref:Uncharacterized protein n=1 Tax=Solanum commersonii TaxID=4109 RepID=A0A9J5XXI7_SOLCO|nr:hypothetical protein H5410_043419 [Solanum commersonii]